MLAFVVSRTWNCHPGNHSEFELITSTMRLEHRKLRLLGSADGAAGFAVQNLLARYRVLVTGVDHFIAAVPEKPPGLLCVAEVHVKDVD